MMGPCGPFLWHLSDGLQLGINAVAPAVGMWNIPPTQKIVEKWCYFLGIYKTTNRVKIRFKWFKKFPSRIPYVNTKIFLENFEYSRVLAKNVKRFLLSYLISLKFP